MVNLDDPAEIKKLDTHNMLGSLLSIDEQLKTALRESKSISLPSDYAGAQNLIVCGMGGSSIGAHFVRSVFEIPVPFQIVNDYFLPHFVNENSLVIASSYSGDTEETISALQDALKRGAKIAGLASGGKVIEILKKEGKPFYQFDPKSNPSGQPRMGLGYSIGGIVGLLNKVNWVRFTDKELQKISNQMMQHSFGIESKTETNSAKRVASSLIDKIPIIVAAEFLAGNAHIFANQINENAKTFGAYFLISEMNHHLLEGIKFPQSLGQRIEFIFLESPLYDKKIKERIRITRQLLSSSNIESINYNLKTTEKKEAAFEALVFSSWTSFYLAIANGLDPTPIPNVDLFKAQLSKLA